MNESLETTQPLTNGSGIMYDTTMIYRKSSRYENGHTNQSITGQLNSK